MEVLWVSDPGTRTWKSAEHRGCRRRPSQHGGEELFMPASANFFFFPPMFLLFSLFYFYYFILFNIISIISMIFPDRAPETRTGKPET